MKSLCVNGSQCSGQLCSTMRASTCPHHVFPPPHTPRHAPSCDPLHAPIPCSRHVLHHMSPPCVPLHAPHHIHHHVLHYLLPPHVPMAMCCLTIGLKQKGQNQKPGWHLPPFKSLSWLCCRRRGEDDSHTSLSNPRKGRPVRSPDSRAVSRAAREHTAL